MRELLRVVGADLRAARLAAGQRQEDLAYIMGWGKDAISKLERGVLNVNLADYLAIISVLSYHLPADYPARALLDYLQFQHRLGKR